MEWKDWKNSFGITGWLIKECGADGFCQFHSISECLKPIYDLTGKELRLICAAEILKMPETQFKETMMHYQFESEEGLLPWDISIVKARRDLADLVLGNLGVKFEGDSLTLGLLSNSLKTNIWIFNMTRQFVFRSQDAMPYTICLAFYNEPQFKHYRALGQDFDRDNLQTMFQTNRLSGILKQIDSRK